jgi:hypothetical protein
MIVFYFWISHQKALFHTELLKSLVLYNHKRRDQSLSCGIECRLQYYEVKVIQWHVFLLSIIILLYSSV